jgi:hypothetical protein
MNPSTSTPLIPSRAIPPSTGFRLEAVALALLLLGASLPTLMPPSACEPTPPTSASGSGGMDHPIGRHAISPLKGDVGISPAIGIRRLPTVVITADSIEAEKTTETSPHAIEAVHTVEIVPLASLESIHSSHP